MRRRLLGTLGPLLVVLALAGCDTAAERAEAHYQKAVTLLAAGDADRAIVELRNVFRLDADHAAARRQYAALLRDRGDLRQALAQYQLLTEQHPDDVAAHRDLATLALAVQDFDTAEIHTARAYALDPADPQARALKASIDFRKGDDRPAAVAMAEGVLAEAPDNVLAVMVLVADRLAAQDLPGALTRLDAGLATAPGDNDLHLARLSVLEAEGDLPAVGAELQTMAGLFPDNAGIRTALVQWHLKNHDPDRAEAVLRAAADADPATPGAALTLAQFLLEIRGPDAARAELEARAAAAATTKPAAAAGAADPRPFARALAGLDFAEGKTDAAIAAMQALVKDAKPSDETRDIEVALAGMLAATGQAEASAALVETVLAEDATHVAALKLRARAEIAADRPDAAIQDMRTALTAAPRDPEIPTIMAFAYERQGDRTQMGAQLALAVEASNRAGEQSLRYANFLMQENRPGPAEGVVVDALRRTPDDRELLGLLGRIHLARKDWTRAGQVAALLRQQGDPVAAAMAASLESARLAGEGRTDDQVALLAQLAGAGADAGAMADLVRAQLVAGHPEAAQAYLDGVLAKDPGSLPGRFLMAGLHAMRGETAEAETLYRAVIAANPALPEPYQGLFTLLAGTGRVDDARAALEAGIAAAPDNSALLFTRAGLREADGALPGAIADYETLYARDSGSEVVANNLASLLTAQGSDSATLARAFAIARRLQGSDVPQFQDTYGWILALRGENTAALGYLAPAAAALPGNAQVQFHLGEAEFALGRGEAEDAPGHRAAAAAAFTAALAAAEAGSPLPQAAAVQARLAEIAAPPAAGQSAPAAPVPAASDG